MISLSDLTEQAAAARQHLEQRRAVRDAIQARIERLEAQYREAEAEAHRLAQIRALFDLAGSTAREVAREQTARMGTEALRTVFGDRLSLEVDLGESRGRPDATFRVRAEGPGAVPHSGDPLEAHGGGVVDVLSVALRFVLLEGAQPPIDGPVLLDEPGKHVSANYAPHLAVFLAAICREFHRQIIMVTHNADLADVADRAYEVTMEGGISRVVEQQGG